METPAPGDGIRVRELGHVALFVRDLDATRRFYRDLLGLTETGTGKNGRVVFFSAGVHHHDLSCELARAEGPGPQPKGVPGLYHIAFDVGVSRADLDTVRTRVVARGLAPFGEGETYFCVRDPDGNEIELYVDGEDRIGDQATARERRGSGRTRQMESTPAASAATAKPNAGR